jgi:PPOX class probable F420-dependent enzyme
MISIDTTTPFGARIARQLDDEVVVWLTTISKSGTPEPTPVWFLWSKDEVLISSQPDKAKLRNIAARPRVSVNFNATHHGGDVGVLTGAAVISDQGLSRDERTAYDKKYEEHIRNLGMTTDQFHQEYSVVIRLTPDKLRGF